MNPSNLGFQSVNILQLSHGGAPPRWAALSLPAVPGAAQNDTGIPMWRAALASAWAPARRWGLSQSVLAPDVAITTTH